MQSNVRFPQLRAALCFALSASCSLGLAETAAAGAATSNLTPLLWLGTTSANGTAVRGDVLRAPDGNFYVAASGGGPFSVGAVQQITPAGISTLIHGFAGAGTEAALPYAGLIRGADGDFYGVSYLGGTSNLGTVYKTTPAGVYTNLHSFSNATQGGFLPYGGLVQVGGADLYGTTLRGGPNDAGTVFKISTTGTQATLATFDGTNGKNPEGQLALGPDGALYGTTLIGGSADRGTVFKITTGGTLTTVYSFPELGAFSGQGVATNVPGANPRAGLLLAMDGNFYGTAYQGGAYGFGTVFRMTPAGVVTPVHDFKGSPTDGAKPLASVAQMADGSLVGTTEGGGSSGRGSAWRIDPQGTYTVLHSFTGLLDDGSSSYATLLPANGYLYGITFSDGLTNSSSGSFFRLELPVSGTLPVSLSITPDIIPVGSAVNLSWTSPTAATCATSTPFAQNVGSWIEAGAVATTGSQAVTPPFAGIYTFILTCTDGAGVVRKAQVPLVVTTPALEPVDGGGDGGGGSFPLLGLALLGGALAFHLTRKHYS